MTRLWKTLGAAGAGFAAAALSTTALAQPVGQNCPDIFYQEPFNSSRPTPEGCPPNAYERQQDTAQTGNQQEPASLEDLQQGVINRPAGRPTLPTGPVPDPSTSSSPPLPEQLSDPVAVATPLGGRLTITLTNSIGAPVSYEVIGDTAARELPASTTVTLQNISLPATIAVVRPDSGLIDVTAVSPETGQLEITLLQDPALDDTQGVISIEADGRMFVN